MAAKKRTKKKQTKSTSNKPAKKSAGRMKPTRKVAKKKPVSKKKSLARKKKPAQRKPVRKKASVAIRTPNKRRESPITPGLVFSSEGSRSGSGGQSGDLQGLSGIAGADSESVDELVEEGNAFEADVVAGVEEAGDEDEKEVRTHEVPEDDVPDEYLEKD